MSDVDPKQPDADLEVRVILMLIPFHSMTIGMAWKEEPETDS